MLVLARNLSIGVVLAFLLLWGLSWYQARASFAELAQALAPHAALDTRSIVVWPNGDVDLRGLRLQVGDSEALGLERLRVHTPGLVFLARFALGTGRELPDELGLSLRGLQPGPWATLQAGSTRPWLNIAHLVPFESFGCGEVALIDAEHLDAMGIRLEPQTQFIGYRMDRRSGRLMLRIELDTPPLSRVELDVTLSGLDPQLLDPLSLQQSRIERAQLRYTDSGYLARRNDWCGRRIGQGVAMFLRAHMRELETLAADLGAAPDIRLLGIYRRLLNEGGSVAFEIRPSLTVPLSRYPSYPPDDLLRLLNLSARYGDGGAVPVDLRMAETRRRQSEQRLAEAAADDEAAREFDAVAADGVEPDAGGAEAPVAETPASEAIVVEPALAASEPVEERPRSRSRREASPSPAPVQPSIPIPRPGEIEQPVLPTERVRIGPPPPRLLAYDELPGLLGQRITIITVQGQRRIGVLRAVDADGVRMDVQISGGTAGVTIPRQSIREIRRGGAG